MVKHSSRRNAIGALFLIVALILAGCSTSSKSSDGKKSDGTKSTGQASAKKNGLATKDGEADALPDSRIGFSDDVVMVQRTKGETVKGLGNDGVSILLDSKNPGVKKLKVGSIMVLTGVGVGRVTDLQDVSGDTAVSFKSVSLPELIQNGDLNWDDTSVNFADAKVQVAPEMAEVSGAAVEPAALQLHADSTVNVKIGEFEASFEWTASDNGGGNLKLELTPQSQFNGKITADVELKPITFGGGTKVKAGKVDFFNLDFKNLQGSAKLTTELQALGPNSVLKLPPFFKVPITVSIPVPVGGIPFALTFGATLQIDLSFATAQSTLKGEANIEFGGPAKFSYKGGKVSLEGSRTAATDDTLKQLLGGGGGPVGLVLTSELPKVSFGLKILQTGAGVFVSNGMVNSLTILPAPVLCHRIQAASVVSGGIDASFLGADVTFTRKAFLDKRWTFYYPKGDKRCDGE